MQTDYHIEDLVHQTGNLVVYRVLNRDQIPFALIRLRYDDELLEKLDEETFQNALSQLEELNHSCLRPVVDGGLDPVDGFPWIAARWWDGILLPDRVRDSDLTPEEFVRIKVHGEALVSALGPLAGTVSFSPDSVVICGQGDKTIDTFSIDYHGWFEAFAQGVHPATQFATLQRFTSLLTYLKRHSVHTPAPLITTAEAPPTLPGQGPSGAPGQTPPLVSSQSSTFPLKVLLVLSTLLVAIGLLSWNIFGEKPSTPVESIVDTTTQSAESKAIKKIVAPKPKPVPEIPPTDRPANDNGFEKFYTIHDEDQIRTNFPENDRFIPVQATVLAVTKSSSGKTLYLQFKNESPEFAASIEIKTAEQTLNEAYLKSLVGKTIQAKGRPKKDRWGERLSIVITKKSQLKVIE